MVALKGYLSRVDFSKEIRLVDRLLTSGEKVGFKISFWGTRVITIGGYEGSIALDTVAKRVDAASIELLSRDNMTPLERMAGIAIVRELREFYKIADSELAKCNFFKKFLFWVCGLSIFSRSHALVFNSIFSPSKTEANFRKMKSRDELGNEATLDDTAIVGQLGEGQIGSDREPWMEPSQLVMDLLATSDESDFMGGLRVLELESKLKEWQRLLSSEGVNRLRHQGFDEFSQGVCQLLGYVAVRAAKSLARANVKVELADLKIAADDAVMRELRRTGLLA